MAIELTELAKSKAAGVLQAPQLVLQIDGVPQIFGIGTVKKYARIGDPDLFIDGSWNIGGFVAYNNQVDAIDLAASSNSISQQLLQDRGGTSSISSVQISLFDDGEITNLITPGNVVPDILGLRANVWLGYQETSWPQDFTRIFSGIIDEVIGGATVVLNVAHPEQKKRAEVFQKVSTKLTADAFYRAGLIQNIRYQTRTDVVGTVAVTYTGGGTLGSEVVTVSGNNITVQISNGFTKAKHIRNAIEKKPEATALVTVSILSNQAESVQVIQSATTLDSTMTLNVESVKGLLAPAPSKGFTTFVRINDEVMEYSSIDSTLNTITLSSRGAFEGTDDRAFATTHKTGDTVESFYRLGGSAIEIALRVLMSGGTPLSTKVNSFVNVEGESIPNAIYFEGIKVQDIYGVTIGDTVDTTGDVNPANNIVGGEIQDIFNTPYGSYLIIAGNPGFIETPGSAASITFYSKWGGLPDGLGLDGSEVDVPEFERVKDTFASAIFDYDFYLKESVQGKDFLDKEVLFPTGAFTLPRLGKISLGFTSPPLASANLVRLDKNTTARPDQTKVRRSINRYFYNNVLFKYNEAVVDDKFLSGDLDVNEDSKNRIKVGNKTLVVEARGLRPTSGNAAVIETLKRKFQDKYKFGGEVVQVSALYGDSFSLDVGDVVAFESENLPDTKSGSRTFEPRLFEVQNKSMSIKTGEVKFDLLDSGYSLNAARYGLVSPSSLVGVGSTTSEIKIVNSFETVSPRIEKQKWTALIGETLCVHDDNWDVIGETVLKGFSTSDDFLMLVDPPLAFTPAEGYVVDVAQYSDTLTENILSKQIFAFTNPCVDVVSGTDNFSFDVAPADVSKFLAGAFVLVRDTEWDIVSVESKVLTIVGNTVTVETDLGFTPLSGYQVDLIGFKDGGAPYRFL